MSQINASIVLYNNKEEEITKVIDCILNTSLDIELYLIDNSENDYFKKLQEIDSRICYIFNNKNIGYGAAHNRAIKKSIKQDCKYHLILNSDISFSSGSLEKLVEFMDLNNDIGIVMPKILYPDGEIQYACKLLPTPFVSFFRRFCPFKFLKEQIDYKYELRFLSYDKIVDVPVLSGCFMFCRTTALNDVNGFDERFFMYAEDLDLSRRINERYRTVFYPDVCVIHFSERGSYKNFKLLLYHITSLFKYFCKWGWGIDKKRSAINRKALNRFCK